MSNKNLFKFIGKDRRVYDQPIEGEPIGYFKDAMIRFKRNKMNVIAAVILGILVMLSIFVPILTNKNYEVIEEQLTYLKPRVPILNKFGILDGNQTIKGEPVVLSTIDPETELGLPQGYDINYVVPGTLTNFYAPSLDDGPTSIGGEVIFRMNNTANNYTLSTLETTLFRNGDIVSVDIASFENEEDATFTLYIIVRNRQHVLGVLDETGELSFTVADIPGSGQVNSRIFIDLQSETQNAGIIVNEISGVRAEAELFNFSAYNLFNDFKLLEEGGGGGTKHRVNNQTLNAAFEYDTYGAVFSSRIINITQAEFDRFQAENPEMIGVEDPENPTQLIYPDGFVLKRLISESSAPNPQGVIFTSYRVEVDYAKYMGYDNIPYFLFGTDASGKDLFALTWVGLRTSLIIGVIVSIINISFGVFYGAISGYYGGKTDLIMERITEVIGRIPWLVTLSIITALMGASVISLIIVLIISGWIGVASVTRTQFYRYKNREYVLASRTMGAKDKRLIFRHILPNGIGTIITSSILMIPGVIFSEASISYLGFGIGHGSVINFFGLQLSGVSLGVLLADGQSALLDFPHLTVYPAIIISILMITFNMFGNGLRDAFNPSLRGAN